MVLKVFLLFSMLIRTYKLKMGLAQYNIIYNKEEKKARDEYGTEPHTRPLSMALRASAVKMKIKS